MSVCGPPPEAESAIFVKVDKDLFGKLVLSSISNNFRKLLRKETKIMTKRSVVWILDLIYNFRIPDSEVFFFQGSSKAYHSSGKGPIDRCRNDNFNTD